MIRKCHLRPARQLAMHYRVLRAICLVAATGVVATGCSVAPSPMGELEVEARARDYSSRLTQDQEPISGAIDLYEAMSRALKFNLDQRVEEMETALRLKELDLSHYNALPNIIANSGYFARNNDSASSSFNVLTGTQNFGASTSQERSMVSRDITFSWNILDFGLSYVRARQAADKFLIAQEMRRKVVHRVIEDVRTAYWRAVSGEVLLGKLKSLEARVKAAQSSSKLIASERSASPITAVTYERELVEIKRVINELVRDLAVAKTQLSALMNVMPGTSFSLTVPPRQQVKLKLNQSIDQLVHTALTHRAELKEVW